MTRKPTVEGRRLCNVCKRRPLLYQTERVHGVRRCIQGFGCQRGTCIATKRNGDSCTFPGVTHRDNGHDGQLWLCGNHAQHFDTDCMEHGPEHAAYRAIHGVGPA